MFNSLNSINSFIIQQKSVEASGYLTTFSKLMRNILENSRQEFISLEKEIATLNLYLELESVRLENKFDFQIKYDRNLEIESIKVPPLIIQPFAENAIWHGLHNKKTTGNLIITISSLNDEKIIISITDDGIGRIASAQLKKEERKHKSYGIEITNNRLSLINTKNKFEIIDLYDHNHQSIGTTVRLEIYIS
jgi:LytS/YehU family sensor histidine kinase